VLINIKFFCKILAVKGEKNVKKLSVLAALLLMMSVFSSAQAEVRAGAFSYGLSTGGHFFEGNQGYKDTVSLGFRAGYNFSENWEAEFFANGMPSEFEDYKDGKHSDIFTVGLEGLYHFMPRNRFVPYLAMGLGGIYYTSEDDRFDHSKFMIDYGVGFKYFVTENLSLRTDVRHLIPLGRDDKYIRNPHDIHNDVTLTLGISYDFEGVKEDPYPRVTEQTTPEVIPDTDKDGVPDNIDKCADTPYGSETDQYGCPPDADRDGVPDIADRCPGTPASIVVDKSGCSPDTDRDGVFDYLDSCQGTPAGVSVDEKGCPPDADKDGVTDSLDKCPRTPAGTPVNQEGCEEAIDAPVSILLKMEFDSGKALIKPQYHKELQTVAVFMKEHPEATATIVGHTDNIGPRKANILLSKKRAESIRQYLIDQFGVEQFRIKAIGYGPDKPVASNATKEGRQKNRRIVALFETGPIK